MKNDEIARENEAQKRILVIPQKSDAPNGEILKNYFPILSVKRMFKLTPKYAERSRFSMYPGANLGTLPYNDSKP